MEVTKWLKPRRSPSAAAATIEERQVLARGTIDLAHDPKRVRVSSVSTPAADEDERLK
jgi:hypothetical protein